MIFQLVTLTLTLTLAVTLVSGQTLEQTQEDVEKLTKRMDDKDVLIKSLMRQLELHEIQTEERLRVEGDSGLAQVHNFMVGTDNYHSFSHIGMAAGSMHDHPGALDVVGWGKFTAVLNGIQFTTRHNDPRMRRASTTSGDWLATEELEFPGVPDTVSAKGTVAEQIQEMQEYFRAFKLQDKSIRNYTDYFKPVLCYLEGTWLKDTDGIEETFESYTWRYFTGGTWDNMKEEARVESILGGVYNYEGRTGDMPRAILGINETTNEPIYGQWTYRLMFHPIDREIPTSYFHAKDDAVYRLMYPDAPTDPALSRGAVFTLDDGENIGMREEKTLLDEIAETVPGLNNLPGTLYEDDFGVQQMDLEDANKKVNLAYYNRRYYGPKGYYIKRNERLRGYADANMYVALNTQDKVAPYHITLKNKDPMDIQASYMIPLEILYLTPIQRWNPHQIRWEESFRPSSGTGGSSTPYSGYTEDRHYVLPIDMYEWRYTVPHKTKADDFYESMYMLDHENNTVRVAASGILSISPEIGNDVGNVRYRYPIFPIHFEGSAIWKAFNAFKIYLSTKVKGLADTM